MIMILLLLACSVILGIVITIMLNYKKKEQTGETYELLTNILYSLGIGTLVYGIIVLAYTVLFLLNSDLFT
ncbi:hypothetical protein [Vagococcus xieshaowenii]|uniref:Uncharacterized protein n=1 Tax=Vagococcus xieshaowenii TaxID=2562451 RepID=A0AAJ5JQN1_9ENTE|nr:hypothetical protein [Vagococcus xieshaowenii]QCA29332.1 hypothetical protein E4Z98_08380 [Vagococcus xieshaowenii]TFZ41973.1 hypothetical protein E4031_04125 [Vagococcus xieshaowenii]